MPHATGGQGARVAWRDKNNESTRYAPTAL